MASPAYTPNPIPEETFAFPLSYTQERLWFLYLLDKDSAAYNIPRAFRLTGPLNIPALEASLNHIISRHEILRTTFDIVDDQPAQIIWPHQNLSLNVVKLPDLPAVEKEFQTRRQAEEEAQRPFNLTTGPLLRATLWQLSEQEHVLLLTTHHMIFDDWSLGILLKELSIIYNARITNTTPVLADLPIQYADFAHWQRESLQDESLEKHLTYWKQQLDNAPPLLNLPTQAPASPPKKETKISVEIPSPLLEALKALGFQENSTLFMILLAAFKVLLYGHTGQDDIVVASPIAGRTQVETEALIGRFTNILLLRTDLSGNPTFLELLGRVKEVAFGAYAHQELPFEKLVTEWSGHSPLLAPVLFQLRTSPQNLLALQHLKIDKFELDTGTEKFELTLEITEKPENLYCLLKYKSSRFQATTIKQMANHFSSLLKNIVKNPNQTISGLLASVGIESYQLSATHRTIKKNGYSKTSRRIIEPQNVQEYQLLTIWQDVLGMHNISVKDNFFELGGHSLLGMRLFAQIEKTIGQKLPMSTLFQSPTIREMARVLYDDDGVETTAFTSLVAIQSGGSNPPFFCLPGNLGNVFTDLGVLARYMGPNQPFYSFQDGLQNPTQVETIAARYIDEMQKVQPKGPYYLGGVCWGSTIAFEMAQQLQARRQAVALLALIEPSEWSATGIRPYFNLALNTVGRALQRFGHHSQSMLPLNSGEQKDYARLKTKVIANRWALLRYFPKPYSGQIDLFLTRGSLKMAPDPKSGWYNLTASKTTVHEIPGTHHSITGKNNTPIEIEHMQTLAMA